VTREVQDLGKMTLLDRITLLDRLEWTPPMCERCRKKNLKHVKLDCPMYKLCTWCKQSGSLGFIRKHRCQYVEEDKMDNDPDYNWGNFYSKDY
jgi:hypothetical protein